MQRSISVFGLELPVADDAPPLALAEPPAPLPAVEDGVEYAWDEAGACTGVRPPGSAEWLLFERGADGSLVVRAESGRVYVEAADGLVRFGNGTAERRSSDRAGRPSRLEVFARDGARVLDLAYAYDEDGRIASLGGHCIEYADDRVASVDGEGLEHDARGNLAVVKEPRPGRGTSTQTFEVDALDRVVATAIVNEPRPGRGCSTETQYEYDDAGCRIARRNADSATTYAYDGDRLVEVARDGRTVVRYGYDARGRRIRREDAHGVVHLHYDARGNLLAETDDEGRALRTYVRDGHRCLARIDGPVGAPAAEWYHLDHTASAWATTDPDGQVTTRRASPLDPGPGPFMGRFRDEATGFHHFGARDYDHETRRFTTPDAFTFDVDDPRLAADPRRDPWGGDTPRRTALDHWREHPPLANRYAFCLGDPVNNVDLDGHSAWWFFLTIPSSLIWAIPNTIVAFVLVLVNLYAEVLGWLVWPFVMAANKDTGLKYYPWGRSQQTGSNPPNPFDLDQRNHFRFALDASTRLGVPWALINGSFASVGRAFTMGNVIFIESTEDGGDEGDTNQRYVVPKEPDTQLTLHRSLREHEMQHTFQYAYLGPFFHCLPLAPLIRLVENKIAGHELTERARWWQMFDVGGAVTLTMGLMLYPLTFGKVGFSEVKEWVNPSSWWQHLIPARWMEIVSQAVNLDNWFPGLGIYELDMIFRGGQSFSFFERNSGAWSGNTYGTVVETEEDEIFVGQFTRVIGADAPRAAGATVPRQVTWGVAPAAPLPTGAPGAAGAPATFNATDPTNLIPLNKSNVLPVQVFNGSGLYFHSTTPGDYTVTGTGNSGAGRTSENVKIKVKDISVGIKTDVFVCENQLVTIGGDGNATYTIRFATNASGGTITNLAYAAGPTAGTDVIEVVATYNPAAGVFKTYGDTGGLASFAYVVKTINVTVKVPTITPSATEVFVGDKVVFTFDKAPATSAATALVPGSTYDEATRTFSAGKGAIDAERTETLTFGYGCRDFPVTIKVKPIVATVAPSPVRQGTDAQVNVAGGTGPYTFEIVVSGSSGPTISATGAYHAGTVGAATEDVVTVTDSKGGRGTVRVPVTP